MARSSHKTKKAVDAYAKWALYGPTTKWIRDLSTGLLSPDAEDWSRTDEGSILSDFERGHHYHD